MRWFEPVGRPVQRQADLSNPLEASELGRRRAPLVGLLLGYGAIAPLALGAAAALLISRGELQAAITRLTLIWGAAILIFLAGVRRGLSFAMPGGATFGEIASSLFLFALGASSLLPPALPPRCSSSATRASAPSMRGRRGSARRRRTLRGSARRRRRSPSRASRRCWSGAWPDPMPPKRWQPASTLMDTPAALAAAARRCASPAARLPAGMADG